MSSFSAGMVTWRGPGFAVPASPSLPVLPARQRVHEHQPGNPRQLRSQPSPRTEDHPAEPTAAVCTVTKWLSFEPSTRELRPQGLCRTWDPASARTRPPSPVMSLPLEYDLLSFSASLTTSLHKQLIPLPPSSFIQTPPELPGAPVTFSRTCCRTPERTAEVLINTQTARLPTSKKGHSRGARREPFGFWAMEEFRKSPRSVQLAEVAGPRLWTDGMGVMQ